MDSYFGSNEVVMPGMEPLQVNTEEFASKADIAKEVSKEVVTTTIIEEVDSVEYPMICIRADKAGNIQPYSIDGLKSVVNTCALTKEELESGMTDDSVPIYIYTSTKLLKCGKGSYNKIYKYLYDYVKTAMSDKIKIYYFSSQDEKRKLDKRDFSKMKLDL